MSSHRDEETRKGAVIAPDHVQHRYSMMRSGADQRQGHFRLHFITWGRDGRLRTALEPVRSTISVIIHRVVYASTSTLHYHSHNTITS
jgi:hypothetical protein